MKLTDALISTMHDLLLTNSLLFTKSKQSSIFETVSYPTRYDAAKMISFRKVSLDLSGYYSCPNLLTAVTRQVSEISVSLDLSLEVFKFLRKSCCNL